MTHTSASLWAKLCKRARWEHAHSEHAATPWSALDADAVDRFMSCARVYFEPVFLRYSQGLCSILP